MSQGILPFKYEAAKEKTGVTSLGGLPLYMDLAHVMGSEQINDRTYRNIAGDLRDGQINQIVTSLLLLNLTGGDSVVDEKHGLIIHTGVFQSV